MASRWQELQDRSTRWSSLQSRGTSRTLAPPDTTAGVFKRQAEDYNMATRLLRRQARRGDAGSALDLIRVREAATERGIQTGGLRRSEEFNAGLMDRVRTMDRGAAAREQAANLNQQRVDAIEQDGRPEAAPQAPGDPALSVGATVLPESKTGAALDIMEGVQSGDDAVTQRGLDSASRLGVTDPTSILRSDKYRKTLDMALGQATSPAEVAMLRERGSRFGVKPEAFDKRAEWWQKRRKTI